MDDPALKKLDQDPFVFLLLMGDLYLKGHFEWEKIVNSQETLNEPDVSIYDFNYFFLCLFLKFIGMMKHDALDKAITVCLVFLRCKLLH